MEQVHLAPEASVVALGGFFQALHMRVEFVLLGIGRPVDARQHGLRAVASPVRARDLHELEGRADFARRRHVGTTAEVEPVALTVDLEALVGRDRVDEFDLEGLPSLFEEAPRLVAAPDLLRERPVARHDLAHALLDGVEVFRRERRLAVEIVVEAILDHGPDRDLRAGVETLDGLGQHMSGIVADEGQGPRIVSRQEFDPGIGVERIAEIDDDPVARHRDDAFGQGG